MAMSKVIAGAALAALVSVADAARVHRQAQKAEAKTKVVSGVPIHNYDFRFVQDEGQRSRGVSADLDWVIMFKAGSTEEDIITFCGGVAKKGACRVTGHAEPGLPFATALVSEQRLAVMLKAHPESVEYVEPDLPVYVIPELPAAASEEPDLWGHDTIKLEQSGFTGAGVHVYVMDTGVRTTHQDFGGRAIPTLDTLLGDGEPVECNGDINCAADTHGHGTHCAGTAAGSEYGAAKEATIHAMKVCCGPGTNTFAAMDWIGFKGEQPAVMTMSLGSWGNSLAAKAAVDNLVEAGVTVLVSAGNNNDDACLKTYAFVDSAITIGSTAVDDARSSFSNYGACVDLWAPGSRILSAGHLDDTSSKVMSGTSMATPLAAGVATLLVEEFPEYTPMQIREELVRRSAKGVLTDLKEEDSNYLLSAV